ncbi:cysteine hydrolase family protein [Vibrio aestuarianus]|uniref:Cysteine hydrolase n=1 Tax=Vibrio aestuarianus TaxID=28171 RepID=A0A9X4F452_9VIBR|nr:cysteine hydrolase family protein [Vibrio aestuarianus]MDE1244225.1 cysteine hydrolase [Vibrio aestuarianus]
MKQALIVIDVQNDYFFGGAMELVGMEKAASNCTKLLNAFRQANKPIFHIQHISTREGATFFVPNTAGCEINESVKPFDSETVVTKHYPSSFRETELNEILKKSGVEELIICGAMTHMCIDTTTRAAFDLGYKCHVISDACATRDLEFNGQIVKASEVQAAFMAALSLPFAEISSTEKYLSIVK